MKKHLSTLLNKPMNRKDFLQHIGVGVAMMMGGGMVVQAIDRSRKPKNASLGYGSSAYGGVKRA